MFLVTVGAVLKTIKEDYLAVDNARYRCIGKRFSGVGVHRSDDVFSLLRRRLFTHRLSFDTQTTRFRSLIGRRSVGSFVPA